VKSKLNISNNNNSNNISNSNIKRKKGDASGGDDKRRKRRTNKASFSLSLAQYQCLVIGLFVILLSLACHSFWLVVQLPSHLPLHHYDSNSNNNYYYYDTSHNNHNYDRGTTLNSTSTSILVPTHSPPFEEHEHGHSGRTTLQLVHQWETLIAQNLSLSSSMNVTSCRYTDCTPPTNDDNNNNNARMVLYNPFDQPRYLCNGQTLDARGIFVLEDEKTKISCLQQQQQQPTQREMVMTTLFPIVYSRHNLLNLSQISLSKWNPAAAAAAAAAIRLGIRGVKASRRLRYQYFRNCDVPCYVLPNRLNTNAIIRTIEGTNWLIITSMEGPAYYKSLLTTTTPPSPPTAHGTGGFVTANDNNAQQQQLFYATTSFESDIPMPYFSWDDYAPNQTVVVPGVDYDKVIHGAVFIARNCQSTNQREALVKNLMELSQRQSTNNNTVLRIDSVSKCLQNRVLPPTTRQDDKNSIMNQYLFYLAFENQNAKDYITEKLWGSLFGSGAVPIYYGAPNIHDHVPPNSIIHVQDYPSALELWEHLQRVASNRSLYESYHAWRKQPLPETFVQKYNFTHTHSTCRMCRWAFAKRHGWDWNHDQQTIEDERVLLQHRRVCWDKSTGLLVHPFREQWKHANFRNVVVDKVQMCNNNEKAEPGCEDPLLPDSDIIVNAQCEIQNTTTAFSTRAVIMAGGLYRRTIWNHDGFLDIFLQKIPQNTRVHSNATASFILEMHLPTSKADSKDAEDADGSWNTLRHNHFWLQRGDTRFTILVNRSVLLASSESGTLQIFLSSQEQQPMTGSENLLRSKRDDIFRLRFLLERVDPTRTKQSTQQLSYFANLAAQDFFNPVERFRLDTRAPLQSFAQ